MTASVAPPLLQPLGHAHGETHGDAPVHSVSETVHTAAHPAVGPTVTLAATATDGPPAASTACAVDCAVAMAAAGPLAGAIAETVAVSAAAPIAGTTARSSAAPSAAPLARPLADAPATDQQYTGKSPRRTNTALHTRTAPAKPQPTAPQTPTPLSAYEEELLRAYSPTLAGTYERWKGEAEGEGMPIALAVMMRQWRIRGCPPDRNEERTQNSTAHAAQNPDGNTDSLGGSSNDSFGDSSPDSSGDSSANSFAAYSARSADTSNYTDSSDNSHGHSAQHDEEDSLTANRLAAKRLASTPSDTQDSVQPQTQAQTQAPAPQNTQTGAKQSDIAAKHAKNGIHCTRSAFVAPTTASPLLRESTPKAAKAAKPDKNDKNAQMTLPGVSVPRTPGETAPMSNYLARTSLFAPIRKGRRVMHDKQMLHSPEGIDVLYTGKQLDMADQDVYLTALRLAGGIKAGDKIVINRAAFLRMLGYKHNPGARDYKWLEESFYRISTGRVIIKAKHIEANLPLMGALLSDTRSGDYYFTIPRETYALWAKNLYSYIDLEKRHALERNVPLSKWLQSYAQSHAPGVHTISMDLLHLWCGYGGRLRDFRDSLTGALDELTRVGILATWSIQERGKGRQKKVMISWTRERTHRDDTPQPALGEDDGRL